ncbi:MAG: NADH-quinone oxidoreductase subunit A [Anaerolineae bacterium]|nr:NADH-quinone oxidoreductase subunit A [Anaerolineae bacterium]
MLSKYGFIGILAVVAFGFPVLGLVVAWLLSPKKPNPIKQSTYECGVETIGDTWVQFRAQYYLFALVFVVFDIETVFLYPWAVAYGQLGLFALVEAALFVLILFAGLVYAWRKGALEWQ